MTFRVGMKVVCVDDSAVHWGGDYPISKGAVYTVREVGVTVTGKTGVRLAEVSLTSPLGMVGVTTNKPFVDSFFCASRFRPVVERKTDISIFTSMLNPSKVDA